MIGPYCFAQPEEIKGAKMYLGGVEIPVESVSWELSNKSKESDLPPKLEPFTCEMSFTVEGKHNAWDRLLELVCGIYTTNDWRWPQLELHSESMAWWFAIARSRTVKEGELN